MKSESRSTYVEGRGKYCPLSGDGIAFDGAIGKLLWPLVTALCRADSSKPGELRESVADDRRDAVTSETE